MAGRPAHQGEGPARHGPGRLEPTCLRFLDSGNPPCRLETNVASGPAARGARRSVLAGLASVRDPAWHRPGRTSAGPAPEHEQLGGHGGTAFSGRLSGLVPLVGALFAWEGLSLARVASLPTLSDIFRVIMRFPVAQWALFALWLWTGWHFFVRGWHFLLRA